MGFVREPFGKATVESRRESFILHYDAGGFDMPHDRDVHPEFMIEDLDDIIAALREYREHLRFGDYRA